MKKLLFTALFLGTVGIVNAQKAKFSACVGDTIEATSTTLVMHQNPTKTRYTPQSGDSIYVRVDGATLHTKIVSVAAEGKTLTLYIDKKLEAFWLNQKDLIVGIL